jgi:hypothetical protein
MIGNMRVADKRVPATEPIQPTPTPDSAGFWRATERGELALCWCAACARYLHPPLERCPVCRRATVFRPVSGAGDLHSFIVVRRSIVPGYRPGHLIGLVELPEQPGLRVVAALRGLTIDEVRIGMPLKASIVDLPGGSYRIAVFGPAEHLDR